jgi:hypothetical protein
VGDVDKGCPDNGHSERRGMQSFTYGCLCRRRVAPVLDAIVSKPIHAFIVYSYFFFFKKLIRGHCHGVVISGDNVTHKYFHRNEKAGS